MLIPAGSFVTLHWFPNRPKPYRLMITVTDEHRNVHLSSPHTIPPGYQPYYQVTNLTFPDAWSWSWS